MQAYLEKLNDIRVKAAQMCSAAEKIFQNGVKALAENDRELGRLVVGLDDEVDSLEVELEGMCLSFLALHAPKASELRYVVAVSRLTIDLERIGDHSAVMGQYAVRSYLSPLIAGLPKFMEMSSLVSAMLSESVAAFFADDAGVYYELAEKDLTVGVYQKELNAALMEVILRDLSKTADSVALINIVRRLERVGDHAKNIAALAPYVSEGTVVRGTKAKQNADIDY
jgi:phosphate transport system protein